MIEKEAVKAVLEKAIEGTDLFVVGVSVDKSNRIVVEIDSDTIVDIDECVRLTRAVEAEFDRDVEDYELEIGSVGLTTTLTMPRQYAKYIGKDVEILTKDGKKLKGELRGCDDEGFVVAISKKVKPEGAKRPVIVAEDNVFKYEEIKYTKYLIEF